MSRPDTITINKSLSALEEAIPEITAADGVPGRAHYIIREIQRSKVIAEARRNYQLTGQRLPKDFKCKLADKYHFSTKHIEHIVYSNLPSNTNQQQLDIFDDPNA